MGKNSKIFTAFLIITVGIFSYSAYKGSKQIDKRAEDYKVYAGIKEYIKNGQNLDVALYDLEQLEKNYPETDTLYLDKASVYLMMEKDDKVEECMQKAFELNPALEKSISLLLVYAEAACNNNNTKKAQELLDKVMSMEEIPDEYKGRVDSLIKKL